MAQLNLLLHYFPKAVYRSDFDGIADRIQALAPDIAVDVLATDRRHLWAMARAVAKPTISVEINRARFFYCLRGKVFRQYRTTAKSQQYSVLEAAGIPVPNWTPIKPDTKLDPAEWGAHVIEKPDRGARGSYVRVRRTKGVRYRLPEDMQEDNPGRDGGMIAQKLVMTGQLPISYRVLTFFGTPLFATRYEGRRAPMYSIEPDESRKLTGSSAVATGQGCEITLEDDADILELARRTHQAFPDVPVLGIDIVRDMDDGTLFVLEVNPDGGTWGLGSFGGQKMMADNGIDLYAQFGALDRAAETLVDVCRKQAI